MDYPVRVVACGRFREEDIEVVLLPMEPLPPGIADMAEIVWEVESERNPALRRGPLLAARSVELVDGEQRLRFVAFESDYGLFMGTTHRAVASRVPEHHQHRATGILSRTYKDHTGRRLAMWSR